MLLNPLPYPNSAQFVAVYGKTTGFDQGPVVYLNLLDWHHDTQTFSSTAIYVLLECGFVDWTPCLFT